MGNTACDKPVLSYWWMRIHDLILGKTELASRLHSVLSAILTALVILEIGTVLFSHRAGFWAGIGWLTCLQVLIHGRLCVADMPMLLGVTVAFWGMLRLLEEDEPPRWGKWFWVLAGGLAFGFLAKGPIALAVPLHRLFVSPLRALPGADSLETVAAALLDRDRLADGGALGDTRFDQNPGQVLGGWNGRARGSPRNGVVQRPVRTAGDLLSVHRVALTLAMERISSCCLGRTGAGMEMASQRGTASWVDSGAVANLRALRNPVAALHHARVSGFLSSSFRAGPEALNEAGKWFWISLGNILVPSSLIALWASQIHIAEDAVGVRQLVILGALLFVCMGVWALLAHLQRWRSGHCRNRRRGRADRESWPHVVRENHPAPKIVAGLAEMGAKPVELRSWRYEEPNLVFYVTHPVRFRKKPHEIEESFRWSQGEEEQPGGDLSASGVEIAGSGECAQFWPRV